jgi:hypothetical protein
LDRELEVYRRELPRLVREHPGEFVLIRGDEVVGFWESEGQAYEAGCERFGPEPFLVRQVREAEQPLRLFIDVGPRCPSSTNP